MATNVWWSAIAIILLSAPLFSLAIKSGKANYQAKRDVSNEERKSVYFNELMLERDYVDEKNMFDFSKTIVDRYVNAYERIRKQKNKVEIDWFLKMKISGILVLLFACLSAAMLAFPAVEGAISIGLYISLVNAISSLSQVISWQLTASLDQFAQDSEYLHDLNHVDALEDIEFDKHKNNDLDLAEFESLEFKNVWFKYPGREDYILKGLSFKILPGKHYSFVGKNGCGKTTISKLILGLYDEYDGEILYNNVSYKKIAWHKKRKISSAVFQDFSKFPVSIKDNIFFGKEYDQSDLNKIIYATDLQTLLEKLPNGLETNLSKLSVEGIDISGGEWQKIAISRCLALETDIKILDEPTASLDALVENKIYEQFGNIVQNKTSIFISHRLGSTKLADTIFVIGNGKVLEEGSHETLMEHKATYYDMYAAQKEWYESEKEKV
ncbi:ABC transporter ATP-binding protein [Streptococcus iniae]|uniref:ATP-binding cassette domain-containing protein n=1 Tax=Streptococcus iniae TaxID=1346 RepID=UPI000AAA7F68|nr:ABC transporter ATP-binding protein [Streptococcus iniae]RLV28429.1 ABC transporter ATP-binding protein [Streptococcus iniae]